MPTVEILKKRVGTKGNYTTVKITSDVALENSEEIHEMQVRMNQILQEEQIKDLQAAMDAEAEKDDMSASEPPESSKIVNFASDKQISCLKGLLRIHGISEKELCARYNVNRVNELTLKDCWQVIRDLKES